MDCRRQGGPGETGPERPADAVNTRAVSGFLEQAGRRDAPRKQPGEAGIKIFGDHQVVPVNAGHGAAPRPCRRVRAWRAGGAPASRRLRPGAMATRGFHQRKHRRAGDPGRRTWRGRGPACAERLRSDRLSFGKRTEQGRSRRAPAPRRRRRRCDLDRSQGDPPRPGGPPSRPELRPVAEEKTVDAITDLDTVATGLQRNRRPRSGPCGSALLRGKRRRTPPTTRALEAN